MGNLRAGRMIDCEPFFIVWMGEIIPFLVSPSVQIAFSTNPLGKMRTVQEMVGRETYQMHKGYPGGPNCLKNSSILRSVLSSLPLQKASKVTKSARVLTSIDNLKLIEEKEQQKMELIEMRKAIEREKKGRT